MPAVAESDLILFLVIDTKPMSATQSSPHIPKIQFRVLIIGRANAGKTTILQRVCDTTDSPIIYRNRDGKKKKVCHNGLKVLLALSYTTQVKIEPSMEVSDN